MEVRESWCEAMRSARSVEGDLEVGCQSSDDSHEVSGKRLKQNLRFRVGLARIIVIQHTQ